MTEAMRHIADRLDVPSHDARLLRLINNAVFALPSAAIVVRITRSTTLHDRVHKVARLAHARLALAYGYDVTQDPDWPTL